ncbi:MAG: tetratricopeptide repeat protein [Candidatus Polarisedimenticolia bacterium]
MRRRFSALLVLAATPLLAGTAPATPRELTGQARQLMEGGNLMGALTVMGAARREMLRESVLDRELADALAGQLYNLGVRFNNGGKAREAMQSFTEALYLDAHAHGVRDATFRAGLRDASLKVARYLVSAGDPEAVLEACGVLARRHPPDPPALCTLGAARLAMQDAAGAISSYEAAAEIDGASVEAAVGAGAGWMAKAGQARGDGDLPAAEQGFLSAMAWQRQVLKLDPGSAEAHRRLGAATMRLAELQARSGDASVAGATFEDAEASLRKAVELQPGSPWMRQDLAMFLFSGGRFEEAGKEFGQLEKILAKLLTSAPASPEAASWDEARAKALANGAACQNNLVVDAINRAQFDRARSLMSRLCEGGPAQPGGCISLEQAIVKREQAFRSAVAGYEKDLAEEPRRATALLALGDLYAQVGQYDRALGFYQRLGLLGSPVPGLRDRMAAVTDPGPSSEINHVVEPPGGRVRLTFFNPALGKDLEVAVKASWLRVTTALGAHALEGDLLIVVHPTRRVFRERAGYRIGGLVKGFYERGRISLFETPSHTTVEWVSALTHEMAHHAVERLGGGLAPRWLSEGVARYIEGDGELVDRARLAGRLSSLPALQDVDDLMRRSWNDPEGFIDARDMSLLVVEEIARRQAASGLAATLRRIAEKGGGTPALESALGMSLPQLDAAWRAALPRPRS